MDISLEHSFFPHTNENRHVLFDSKINLSYLIVKLTYFVAELLILGTMNNIIIMAEMAVV